MKALRAVLTLALLGYVAAASSDAASLFTETFSVTNYISGWQDRESAYMPVTNSATSGNPGGCLAGSFSAIGFPSPQTDAFVATGLLETAHFMGDYTQGDAVLLGFDFRANQVVPYTNNLLVRIKSDTNSIERYINNTIHQTGIWYSLRFSLLSPELGNWKGKTNLFSSIMTNVTLLEFEITRNGLGAQTYLLDNIFIDRLPRGGGMQSAGGSNLVVFSYLRTNENYRVEVCTNLADSIWLVLTNFTATNFLQAIPDPDASTNAQRFYRMVMP